MSKSEREAIARIINPAAWMVGPSSYGLEADDHEGFMRTWGSAARLVALDKADAILALASTPPKPAAEDVVEQAERVIEKADRDFYFVHDSEIRRILRALAAANLLRTDKEPS